MARYTRMEIQELCKRLENRAHSVVNVQPAMSGDMLSAAMLLRLMMELSDIKEVDVEQKVIGLPTKQIGRRT